MSATNGSRGEHADSGLRPQRAGSVRYIDAGAAQRAAVERAAVAFAAGEITGLDLMTLHVVFALTTSRSKLVDRSSARQVASGVYARPVDGEDCVTGGQRRRVRDSLARLQEAGVIELEAARGGANAATVIAVPQPPNMSPPDHVLQREHVPSPEHPTCPEPSTQRVPTARQHREDREVSEEREADPLARELHRACSNPQVSLSECEKSVARARRLGVDDQVMREVTETVKYPSEFDKAIDARAATSRTQSAREPRWFECGTCGLVASRGSLRVADGCQCPEPTPSAKTAVPA